MEETTDLALRLVKVTKQFAEHTAVSELSLDVPRGTIYGILGPNGAGKSTTLRMVMDIIARDAGQITMLGVDPVKERTVLKRVGYMPEERGLYKKMPVLDVIVFFAELKGMKRKAAAQEARVWLERMGLAAWTESRVETLSKGMQQKVQFITTVLHNPDLLILDEPQSGLDPVNQEVLRETIQAARDQGRTVLLSTHNMAEAEQMCEFVCIIANGKKVLDGRVSELRRSHRGNRFYIEFDTPTSSTARYIAASPRFVETEARGIGWEVELARGGDTRTLLDELNSLDAPLCRFEHLEPTLHDIFVTHVGNAHVATRHAEPVHA